MHGNSNIYLKKDVVTDPVCGCGSRSFSKLFSR